MNYDMISNMKVDELKSFLKLRGLKTSGRKEELIARVFIAFENDVPLVKTAVEVEEDLKETYFKKLKIDDRNIPDPFQIPHGWCYVLANACIPRYFYIFDVFSC